MHAASLLQQEVWQLHAEAPLPPAIAIPTGTQRLRKFDVDTRSLLATLRNRAVTPMEPPPPTPLTEPAPSIRPAWKGFRRIPRQPETTDQTLDRDRLYAAGQVLERADHIREINDGRRGGQCPAVAV